jgi:glycosyltransferase involved in cell wall biosynthesis
MTREKIQNPKISVLMPVYNVAEFVAASIESILNQTFQDFEFIIIDDGSNDGTSEAIGAYKDPRIVFVQRRHLGTVYQLNFGLAIARGKYIARQDGDDWSHPKRFEKQIDFLESHPDYGVVSSAMSVSDEKGSPIKVLRYPAEPDFEKLINKCCISHAASMWRRDINDRIGGYDEQFNKNCCEDYDFWLRVVEHYRIHVQNEVLYTKRERPGSSIGQTRWTLVPIYDNLARSNAWMRRNGTG